MKRTILAAAALLIFAACGNNAQLRRDAADRTAREATTTSDRKLNADEHKEFRGNYTGTFPAADGPGIRMHLKLRSNGRYDLEMKYIDRDTKADEKGSYTVEGNLLTLRPDDNGEIAYYRIGQNSLARLNSDRQPVTGALAKHYVLTKE